MPLVRRHPRTLPFPQRGHSSSPKAPWRGLFSVFFLPGRYPSMFFAFSAEPFFFFPPCVPCFCFPCSRKNFPEGIVSLGIFFAGFCFFGTWCISPFKPLATPFHYVEGLDFLFEVLGLLPEVFPTTGIFLSVGRVFFFFSD